MHTVMVAGAGKIGSLIACLLAGSGDYQVHLVDVTFSGVDVGRLLEKMPTIHAITLDVTKTATISKYLNKHGIDAVISSLPFFLNQFLAEASKLASAHYFDLTEDVQVAECIKKLAKDASTAFVPRCGLAPGFTGIVAHHLIQTFEHAYHAKLRVGALPKYTSNALNFALTWSTDGLINEYHNVCQAIVSGKLVQLSPLEDLEQVHINGAQYEAFNTSGGLGNLAELFQEKIMNLNYKTLRYKGHCEKMRFLMQDLKLGEDREGFKHILEKIIPKTYQDMVIVYVTVEGLCEGEFSEKSYVKIMEPTLFHELQWSAIQASTASGVCAVVDLLLKNPPKGFISQETLALKDILNNRFGCYFS